MGEVGVTGTKSRVRDGSRREGDPKPDTRREKNLSRRDPRTEPVRDECGTGVTSTRGENPQEGLVE